MRSVLSALCLTSMIMIGCATDLVGDPAALDKIEYPSGITIHPNGKYAYVVGSNFDLKYRATDGGAIYIVDLENQTILPTSKRIGSFGTNIVLSSDGRHGYTVTRDDDALVWFEISEDGSSIYCPKADDDDDDLLDCRVIVDDDPTFVSLTHSYREIPATNSLGQPTSRRVEFDLLMIAQLKNAKVMAVTVRNDNGSLFFSKESASLVYTASEIAHLGGENFVVTGRAASNLVIASPAINANGEVKGIYAHRTMSVPNAYGAYLGRGMTTDPTGLNLYMINQYPDSLMRFDISGLMSNDNATDQAQISHMMTLPEPMSKIQWVGSLQTGMLYLTSVSNDSLYIIDPRRMEIDQVIQTGKGPYELYLWEQTLYVLNFMGNSIWTYDVSDPANPTIQNKLFETSETDSASDKQ